MTGRAASLVLILLLLVPVLAGCGRRSQPRPPAGTEITYPRNYPYEPEGQSPPLQPNELPPPRIPVPPLYPSPFETPP